MKNTFGSSVTVTLFGESHGDCVGAVLDGLAPGIPVEDDCIRRRLAARRPQGTVSTARREPDEFSILSGVFDGRTTGTPLCIRIPNTDTDSTEYEKNRTIPRPGHADYAAVCKYHGYADYRGGGHFSGRLTAALTAAGAVLLSVLEAHGIFIGTHILRCKDAADRPFAHDPQSDLDQLRAAAFPVLEPRAAEAIQDTIRTAGAAGDSVGGILQTAVTGLPAGVGEPWFDTVEGVLAHALFSIPAIKGVEFGDSFSLASMTGSQANDAFTVKGGRVATVTNHNGGVNGGITNGMPLIFQCAVKPTPSIAVEQDTVDLAAMQPCRISVGGRHDPAVLHRAVPVVDSVTAITICDLLATRFGTDWPQALQRET